MSLACLELSNQSCRIASNDTVSIGEWSCDDRACPHNSPISENDTGEDNRIHPNPASFPDRDVPSRKVCVEVMQIVVGSDNANIRADVGTMPYSNLPFEILNVGAGRLEVIQIIRMKRDVFRVGDMHTMGGRK